MCGISGIVHFNNLEKNADSLVAMTQSMKKRGPDDEGYVLIDNNSATSYHGDDSLKKEFTHIETSKKDSFKIGLGFRQLKIIDLSNDSHQPMTDPSKNFWVVFNGEIYNYKEIRSELESIGYTFVSKSDTEVLLKAYIEWNEKALDKFNGMFAFAIFDRSKNELFIGRDRIGIKPLFFYKNKNHFLFASTVKSIIDSNLYSAEIDWEGLLQNFKFSVAQSPFTCFKDIETLDAGCFLRINLNTQNIEKKRYWEIPLGTQDFSMTEKKATELIEEALYASIKYRLNADVEVGTFMSGGIDSTTISVLASKMQPNIKTLTLGFKDYEKYDETKQAKDTADLHNLNHILATVHPNEVLKTIEQTTIAYEEPYHSLSGNFSIAKIASENNLKVVLSGLGGDELFGGYDVYKKLGYWNSLKKNKSLIRLLPNIHQKIRKGKQISQYQNLGEFYEHYYTTYRDEDLKSVFLPERNSIENNISDVYNLKDLQSLDAIEKLSYYNLKSYIGSHQMRSVDRSAMHFSLEGRFPMLDHNFIAAAFKVPSKFKLKNKQQKYILRQVAKKHIAPSCLEMSKKGLGLPIEFWIHNDLKEFVFDSVQKLKNRSIFNNTEIDRILKSKDVFKIWQLVSTEVWLHNFISKK